MQSFPAMFIVKRRQIREMSRITKLMRRSLFGTTNLLEHVSRKRDEIIPLSTPVTDWQIAIHICKLLLTREKRAGIAAWHWCC
jgi:hypothetical protein